MREAVADPYLARWDAREYLRQYYATPITADDIANTRFAADHLRRAGRRYATALEFGCGPTVHHVSPLAPYVESITLADYLPANLIEARRWLSGADEAFDWDLWLAGSLAVELELDERAARLRLEERKRLVRSVVDALVPCDILRKQPLGRFAQFDLVASYYCLEALGLPHAIWAECFRKLCALVRPGGALLLGTMRDARVYRVLGREYPVTPIDEGHLAAELRVNGFAPERTRIEVAEVPEFADEGFEAVCCAFAVKAQCRS